jgi:hypothetical protein
VANFRISLGSALAAVDRRAEAQDQLLDAERTLSISRSAPPEPYRACLGELAGLYQSWHKAEPGKGYDARAAEWKGKIDLPHTVADPVPR